MHKKQQALKMKQFLHKSSQTRNFYFFLFYFLTASLIWAAVPLSLQLQVRSPEVVLRSDINSFQRDKIERALLNGVDYHLHFAWYVQKKSLHWFIPNQTAKIVKKKMLISYSSVNRSYFLKMENVLLPFKNFDALMQYVLHYETRIDLRSWQNGAYRAKVQVEGYSIKLFFPLNFIYRILLNTWNFNATSNWEDFDFTNIALSQ